VNIPNIDSGITMTQFDQILKQNVKTRTMEYYQWRDYQNSIKYAGKINVYSLIDLLCIFVQSFLRLSALLAHI
jgi:hypothetical protein